MKVADQESTGFFIGVLDSSAVAIVAVLTGIVTAIASVWRIRHQDLLRIHELEGRVGEMNREMVSLNGAVKELTEAIRAHRDLMSEKPNRAEVFERFEALAARLDTVIIRMRA